MRHAFRTLSTIQWKRLKYLGGPNAGNNQNRYGAFTLSTMKRECSIAHRFYTVEMTAVCFTTVSVKMQLHYSTDSLTVRTSNEEVVVLS